MFRIFKSIKGVISKPIVKEFTTHTQKKLTHSMSDAQSLVHRYPNQLTNDMLIALEEARGAALPILPDASSALATKYPHKVSKTALDEGLKHAETLRKKSSVY